jgi:hypothetical protein
MIVSSFSISVLSYDCYRSRDSALSPYFTREWDDTLIQTSQFLVDGFIQPFLLDMPPICLPIYRFPLFPNTGDRAGRGNITGGVTFHQQQVGA